MPASSRPPGRLPWWQSAVVYQIYPRSFAAGEPAEPRLRADGRVVTGNLDGIRRRLDYLSWLGVTAIWISPVFRSPMRDFGYDVSDYCDIDPMFGTLGDFDRLLQDAHERGLRVLLDWVPNHTSSLHPWFLEARSSRSAPKRDWYIWRDGSPDVPPNNWLATFVEASAWTWDDLTGQWYLHLFLPEQPDLNWRNPEVVSAMHDTLRFWLDRGVDGFRVDAVHALGKDPAFPDAEGELAALPWSVQTNHESVHEILRGLRELVDSYPGERVLVGEVFLLSTALVARYYGDGDELHMSFNFPPLFAPWDEGAWTIRVRRVVEELDPRGAWPTWVLSNHDNPRHRTRYGRSEARARAAAVLLLTLRGTPFLYQGEELGLEDARVEHPVDPGGRDGCRAPIPWDASSLHGWPSEPWLAFPPESGERNTESLREDPDSILHLYRRLLAARRSCLALSVGDWRRLEGPAGVLAYERSLQGQRRVVLVNFGRRNQQVRLPRSAEGTWVVEVSTDRREEGTEWSGKLAAESALVLR